MPLSFGVRDEGICKVLDWSMTGGNGCRPATPTELEMLARIAELEVSVRRGIACIESMRPMMMWDGVDGAADDERVGATLSLMRETV